MSMCNNVATLAIAGGFIGGIFAVILIAIVALRGQR